MQPNMQAIRVVCCLFPTGEAFWMEAVLGPVYLNMVIETWKEKNPEYTKLNVTGGMIELWMLRGDYESRKEDNMELPEDFHERLNSIENAEDTN